MDDIQAAKGAGLKVIIIMGKENSKAELPSAGPHQLVYDLNELLTFLTGVTC